MAGLAEVADAAHAEDAMWFQVEAAAHELRTSATVLFTGYLLAMLIVRMLGMQRTR